MSLEMKAADLGISSVEELSFLNGVLQDVSAEADRWGEARAARIVAAYASGVTSAVDLRTIGASIEAEI